MKRKIFSCLQSVPTGNRLAESFELAAYQKTIERNKTIITIEIFLQEILRCER